MLQSQYLHNFIPFKIHIEYTTGAKSQYVLASLPNNFVSNNPRFLVHEEIKIRYNIPFRMYIIVYMHLQPGSVYRTSGNIQKQAFMVSGTWMAKSNLIFWTIYILVRYSHAILGLQMSLILVQNFDIQKYCTTSDQTSPGNRSQLSVLKCIKNSSFKLENVDSKAVRICHYSGYSNI